MKSLTTALALLIGLGLLATDASASLKKSVSYKIGVIIPPHIQITQRDNNEKLKETTQAPQDQFFIEETVRNNQPVLIKTAVVK